MLAGGRRYRSSAGQEAGPTTQTRPGRLQLLQQRPHIIQVQAQLPPGNRPDPGPAAVRPGSSRSCHQRMIMAWSPAPPAHRSARCRAHAKRARGRHGRPGPAAPARIGHDEVQSDCSLHPTGLAETDRRPGVRRGEAGCWGPSRRRAPSARCTCSDTYRIHDE